MKRKGSVRKAIAGRSRCGLLSAGNVSASTAHLQLTFTKISCYRFANGIIYLLVLIGLANPY